MDPRALAPLLSSLISQLLLLLLVFPSLNPPLTISNSHGNYFALICNLLSTSEIAASLSLLSRKRKRTHLSDPNSPADDDQPGSELVQLSQVDSAICNNPDSFKLFYKMSSSTFQWLAGLLEPLLDCRDPAGSPLNLPAETRLGIGLFRLSTGADYPEISRRFTVSDSISKFCVKQLCRVLCTNFRFWIGFPSPNELQSLSSSFESLSGLPSCCGVITTTTFQLSEFDENPQNSIKAQLVVDSSCRILSITAGFRGVKRDYTVLKNSTLYKDIEAGKLLDAPPTYINNVAVPQYFVGDGEYPLLPWLIVAFSDPVKGSCEENLNVGIHLMRKSTLRAIASLRNWGVLNRPIEAEFKAAVAYIGACSILHNVLLMREDYSALSDEVGDFSVHDRSIEHCSRGDGVEGSLIGREGLVIRRVLATRANEIHKPDQQMEIDK